MVSITGLTAMIGAFGRCRATILAVEPEVVAVMMAVALLERNPDPDEAAVRRELSGNLCRCGTHVEIIRAVLRAAQLMREAQA